MLKRLTRQEREQRALQNELRITMRALRANEASFEEAREPYIIEQLTYQHAALMCRCRALLRSLRTGGDSP